MTDIISNPITGAREKLGWSLERLAANAGMTTDALKEIEAAEFTAEGPQLFILRIFAARRVEFVTNDVGVAEIIGPCDDESLAKLNVSGADIKVLKGLEGLRSIGARLTSDQGLLASLRRDDLVQLANCKFVAMFDDGEVAETQPYFHLRLSKRGRALLDYLARKPKSTLILPERHS